MSLQSAVETHFRGTQNDQEALARKIEETWNDYDSMVFRRIYDRWVLALDLIFADVGSSERASRTVYGGCRHARSTIRRRR
jgi:hypothetical protein